jgi:hypothetical protein
MAELAPSFCMPACCLYNARQPQTLRQNQLAANLRQTEDCFRMINAYCAAAMSDSRL